MRPPWNTRSHRLSRSSGPSRNVMSFTRRRVPVGPQRRMLGCPERRVLGGLQWRVLGAFLAFVLCLSADAAAQRAVSVPLLDVGAIRLELEEDEELSLQLPDGVATNGTIDSVRVTRNAPSIARVVLEEPSSTSRVLRILPAPDSSGTFTLRIFYTLPIVASDLDTVTFADVEGIIRQRTDIRPGILQNSESRRGRPGLVRVLSPELELLAEIRADASGRFPGVQIPDRASYIIQAAFTKDDELFGFVRTISVTPERQGADIELPVIRLISFDGLAEAGIDSALFKEHVLMVTRGRAERWDLEEMNGVYVDDRSSEGRFSRAEIEQISARFTQPDAVPAFVGGRAFHVASGASTGARPFQITGSKVVPDCGWIVIVPDSTMDGSSASHAEDSDGDGYYDNGVIRLNPARAARFGSTARLVTYEAGRVLGMDGDSDPMNFTFTMMVPGIGPQVPESPTGIDRKTGAILYDEGIRSHADLDAVLGLQFDPPAANLTSK